MARHPDVPGQPASFKLQVRLTENERKILDLIRGDVSRSTWVRDFVRAELLTRTGIDDNEKLYPGKGFAPPDEPLHPESPLNDLVEGVSVVPPRKDLDRPHRHTTTEVARRTIKGVTVKTVKCLVCEEQWER